MSRPPVTTKAKGYQTSIRLPILPKRYLTPFVTLDTFCHTSTKTVLDTFCHTPAQPRTLSKQKEPQRSNQGYSWISFSRILCFKCVSDLRFGHVITFRFAGFWGV